MGKQTVQNSLQNQTTPSIWTDPTTYLYIMWGAALIGVLGSLYFSEILKFPPCILCWYQRIALYPVVIIIGVALYFRDRVVQKASVAMVLILAGVGWLISLYHNLLYYKIIPESNAPCSAGISCTTKYIEWFGFITIPLLAFAGLSLIILCALLYRRAIRNN